MFLSFGPEIEGRQTEAAVKVIRGVESLHVHDGTPTLTRRSFIKTVTLSNVYLSAPAIHASDHRFQTFSQSHTQSSDEGSGGATRPAMSPAARATLERVDWNSFAGVKHLHGFNYQPSWGRDAVSIWLGNFSAQQYRQELTRGKSYFPGFNCVRIWLGYGAYRDNPRLLISNFNTAVDICARLELLVIPVLFTIWDGNPPFDPISVSGLNSGRFQQKYAAYLVDIVGPNSQNENILAWDLCNEPVEGNPLVREIRSQSLWLQFIHDRVKRIAPAARTCVGTVSDLAWGLSTADYCDLLTPHLYGYSMWKPAFDAGEIHAEFESWFECMVDQYVVRTKLLTKHAKPILSTETCWGARDDVERRHIIDGTLRALKRHGIGFLPHALYTSPVADLHIPDRDEAAIQSGVAEAASMAFINSDGSLRPGHQVFNDYC